MEFTNLPELGTQLLAVSAITKVLVDIVKIKLKKKKHSATVKTVLSYLIPIATTLVFNISLFEAEAQTTAFYIGSVGAGLIAGLGSTYIHEILKSLQTLKGLKK